MGYKAANSGYIVAEKLLGIVSNMNLLAG